MPTIVHLFDWPDRFIVDTIGQPGSRAFYLQARTGNRIVSVGLEKIQAAVLAEKIDEILDELMTEQGNQFSVPVETPVELVDNEPLEPVDEQFRAGAMSLGWDPATAQVVIEAFPLLDDDEIDVNAADPEPFELDPLIVEPAELLVVRIPVGTARAFAKRTREVVGAGRPLCPLCGMPMDAEGHACAAPGGPT